MAVTWFVALHENAYHCPDLLPVFELAFKVRHLATDFVQLHTVVDLFSFSFNFDWIWWNPYLHQQNVVLCTHTVMWNPVHLTSEVSVEILFLMSNYLILSVKKLSASSFLCSVFSSNFSFHSSKSMCVLSVVLCNETNYFLSQQFCL